MSTIVTRPKRNVVAYTVIGLFVGLCAVGWAIIVGHSEGTPGIDPQIISWQAADRSVRVHYDVGKPEGSAVSCAIVAYDTKHAEVGRAPLTVPVGTSDVEARRDVPTTSRATAVDIRECREG